MADARPLLAVIGGTGDLGGGLALRWAKAGYPVVIGSRAREKAENAARDFNAKAGVESLRGLDNAQAAAAAEIVVLTVPFASQRAMLEAIRDGVQGKILIDTTVPLMPPKVMRVQLPPEGSAAKAAQLFLGENVRVVSAFHNIAADHLQDLEHAVDCDVLVCGDDVAARETVIGLIEAIGLKGWHAGPLDNSVVPEGLTSILIGINRRYKIDGAGIRITGEPAAEAD